MCDQTKIDFSEIPWERPARGVKFKAVFRDGKKLRLVEFSSDFVEEDWCVKGHIGYVLQGELEISFADKSLRFSAGDGLFIIAGESEKHKARVI